MFCHILHGWFFPFDPILTEHVGTHSSSEWACIAVKCEEIIAPITQQMRHQDIPPLPADPKRQAEAMLRACEYQILHTVSAWLDLRGEEVLHVEGSEDFDCVTHESGEAVQVKSSREPISLGQREVQEALSNYWELWRSAGQRFVRFRYLTRAGFAVEKDGPFGRGVACLEVWNRRSIDENDLLELARFLARGSHISNSFKQWLGVASAAEVRNELVERVTWQTQVGDSEAVERSIDNKLIAYAENRGPVVASVIRNIRVRLVQEVWTVLRKPAPRRLDSFLLGEIWEDVTRVSVSRSFLDSILSSGSPHGDFSQGRSGVLRVGIPPYPGKVTKRAKLVRMLSGVLADKGAINITGSSRTGKTTLAKLVASCGSNQWRWWSGAGKQTESVERALNLMLKEIAWDPSIECVVLDDLDFSPAGTEVIEEQLGEFLVLLLNRRGQLLITSQVMMPSRLRHKYGIDEDQCIIVPRMQLEEIEEVAQELGCLDSIKRSGWAKLVLGMTGGHPLLVGARMMALRNSNWPLLSLQNLDAGDRAIEAEKADARQLLQKLPSDQRELVRRLSVFPSTFRREHAVAFGATPPPLTAPGYLFDPLVGPWVEPLHGDYFALSPLLIGGAKADLTPEDFKALQEQAALALLNTNPCFTTDAASAFSIAWEARSESLLSGLVAIWVQSGESISEALADELRWLSFVALVPGEQLFPENAALSVLLRCIQFRVAALIGPRRVVDVYNAWVLEIEMESSAECVLPKMLIAVQIILSTKGAVIPAKVWVGAIGYLSEALFEDHELLLPGSFPEERLPGMDYLPKWDDPVCMVSFMCGARCDTADFLESFLAALESIHPELMHRILRGFVGAGTDAMMAIDRVWLHEADKTDSDWEGCIRAFEKAIRLGLACSCVPLSDAGLKGLCVVYEEYLSDVDSAQRTLDEALASGGFSSHVIHDRRGGIFFNAGQYRSAENQWRIAFEAWPKPAAPFDTYAAFAARNAGICAARLGDWIGAAVWFERMNEYSPREMGAALSAGVYADWGYCLWKAGLKVDSFKALLQAWQLADTLPSGVDDFRSFVTRKTVGHVIAWLNGVVTVHGSNPLHEPVAGTCSSQELPEGFRDLPETESANVWLFLVRIERELGAGSKAMELGRAALMESRNVATRSLAAMEVIAQSLLSGRVGDLPAEVVGMMKAIKAAVSDLTESQASLVCPIPAEDFNKGDGLSGTSVFLAGLLVSQAVGIGWERILAEWRRNPAIESKNGWSEWFDSIELVLSGDLSSSWSIVRDPDAGWSLAMLAAWRICIDNSVSPEILFYAHARWLIEIQSSPWLVQTGRAFCSQVILAWEKALKKRALLRSPRLTVPAIEAALKLGEDGVGKSARILLAASAAVKVKLPAELRIVVNQLATKG